MAVKHNDRRKTKERAEVLPTKAVGPRPERFRPPEIVIEAVAFTRPGTIGDYGWQLQPEQYREFGRTLHVYNENMQQQNDKTSRCAGGGNAIARPFRQYGRSIGMPTGHYGGFQSLDELCLGHNFNCTAKEGIDLATEEIQSLKEWTRANSRILVGAGTEAGAAESTRLARIIEAKV